MSQHLCHSFLPVQIIYQWEDDSDEVGWMGRTESWPILNTKPPFIWGNWGPEKYQLR